MNKMIVAVFADQAQAAEGARALGELADDGHIAVYAHAMVARDASGKLTVNGAIERDPLGAALVQFTGGMIGLLGRPVRRLPGASLVGSLGGALFDLTASGVDLEFLAKVERELMLGEVTLIAEIEEEWVTPLDARMNALGAPLLRKSRSEAVVEQTARKVAEWKGERADLNRELEQAVGAARAPLRAKVDAANARLNDVEARVKAKLDAARAEGDAKLQHLEQRAVGAPADAKTKMADRAEAARAEVDRRATQLHQAWAMVKDALQA